MLLLFILRKFHRINFKNLLLYNLLLLSVSYTSKYFRILYPERYIILILGIIYFFNMLLASNSTNIYLKRFSFILIILLGNYVIHLKEPTILCIMLIGIGNILFFKYENKKQIILYTGIALILSCVLVIALYIIYILPNVFSRYGSNGIPFFTNLLKSIVEWTLADPLIMVMFLPIFVFKMYRNYINKVFDFYDILSFGAIGYMFTFFATGMAYSQHYFTPVYLLIIPFLVKNYQIKSNFKYLLVIAIILQLGNVSLGINDIIFQKQNNRNFSQVIEKMNSITKENYKINKIRTTFHVLGGKDQGNHFSYGALYFMNKKGSNEKMFDFASFENIADTAYCINILEKPPYTFMNTNINKQVMKGDYILYTPYTLLNSNSDGINKELIFSWQGKSYLGYLNFKDLIRLLISKFYKNKVIIRDNKSYRVANYKLYKVN